MRSIPGWGVVSAAAAPVLLIGGWTVAARLQAKGFDSKVDTISALAARDAQDRWLMTAALAGVGVAHVGTALALRPATPVGRGLLAVGGLATGAVAAFPLPTGDGDSRPHAVAAATAFLSLALWPALGWRRPRQSIVQPGDNPVPGPFRPSRALPASAVLLGALGWFGSELAEGSDRVGLSERVAAGTQALWPLAAVLLARYGSRTTTS